MTMTSAGSAKGKCPVCAMPVGFIQAAFKRGKLFQCEGCQHQLRVSKVNKGQAAGAFVFASLLGKAWGLLAVFGVLALVGLHEWFTARVSVADKQAEPAVGTA